MSVGSAHPDAAPVPGEDATPAPVQGAVVVTLPDEIDVVNDGHVQDSLTRAQSDGAAVLVADGSGISFCGNCGVTALLAAHHRATAAGTQLRVVASPALRRIVELVGTDDVLDTYPTLAAALEGRTGSPHSIRPEEASA